VAVLRPEGVRRAGERVERSATLEWAVETRRIVISAPGWAEPWVEAGAADALVLAALPWLETGADGVRLRVRGVVSADLMARLRRRFWLRRERGQTRGGVVVRADASGAAVEKKTRAALHYRGDIFSVAAAVELAREHRLYPRPELALGETDEVPGGEAGKAFLRGLGLR
jgi:hypothetical protein